MRSALGLDGLLLLLTTRPVLHRHHWVDQAPRLAILACTPAQAAWSGQCLLPA